MELNKKQIVLNCEKLESRFAVLANGKLEEYIVERYTDEVKVGSIYLGKIVNLQPSLQAAFVDIGSDKNAFLHYSDILDSVDDVLDMQNDIIQNKTAMNQELKSKKLQELAQAAKLRKKKKLTVDNIPEYFRQGTELLVQVIKGPISTKGARVSTSISIAGRFLVMMPYADHIGISNKIDDTAERNRLKKILKELEIPEGIGLICRTVGEGQKPLYFKRDLELLLDSWKHIEEKISQGNAPLELYREPNLIERTARDFMTDDIGGIVVDDKNAYRLIHSLLKKYGGLRMASKVKEFKGKELIFDAFNVNRQLYQLLGREVNLNSGGYLCIDETEALIAIDVNSGRAGRKKIEQPDLILRTNLEAAEEVARQLRLRNIGGLVVIDFIDMKSAKDRDAVYQIMRKLTKDDRAKTKVLPISQMGLMEMTRQREQESLKNVIFDPCPYCKGSGHVKSTESMSVEIQRALNVITKEKKYKKMPLRLIMHPEVLERLKNEDSVLLVDIEEKSDHELSFRSDESLHFEEFKILDAETNNVLFP